MANTKRLTIIAGVNGAGKTTFYYANKSKEFGTRLCADDVLVKNSGDWRNLADQVKSGFETLEMQKQMFEKGESFSRETTLCGMETFKTIMEAKKHGYFVHLIYIGLESSELAKNRVHHRVETGGHGVPDEVIERRQKTSIDNLIGSYKYCDLVNIFDNSGKKFCNVANIIDNKLYVLDKKCKWCQQVVSRIKEDMAEQELKNGFLNE